MELTFFLKLLGLLAIAAVLWRYKVLPLGMAATFDWQCDHGAATGSPAKGTTRSTGVANNNYKNADDEATAYSSSPIVAGNNSYDRWLFGKFTGTFNQILNGLFAHTAGALGTGLTLKGKVQPSGGYTTPSTSANANLSVDMTSAIAIGSGQAVQFGATGPEAAGKASSTTSNPGYSEWLTTQLQTTGSAAAGDITSITLTLRYDEN